MRFISGFHPVFFMFYIELFAFYCMMYIAFLWQHHRKEGHAHAQADRIQEHCQEL